MATRKSAEQKAVEIKKLREQGKSDAEIIAANPLLQAGFAWLVEHPEETPPEPKASKPKGSGAPAHNPKAVGSYGTEPRLPKLV